MRWNILIWGTGYRAEKYLKCGYFQECKIIGFVDTYKKSEQFYGYKIFETEEVTRMMEQIDYLIVASQYCIEIYDWCLTNGIEKDKIIFSDYIDEMFIKNNLEIVKTLSTKFYNDIVMSHYKLIKMNECDMFDKDRVVGTGEYNRMEYTSDYFRYRTFEFMANELIASGTEGAVAEFGVFRGIFAALIN